ncbi:hypothetical protein [Acinetobacter pittii]|uniref:hypothetical protein n=1 Tax=Acinetobacter pittii TaxID=48296 RepID=UPI00062A69EA|nr:hypothetical protein [Acinetobacter pittii]TGU85730.1 hypothetical protein YA64_015585 [Acinetobacter pittii]
MKKIHFSLLSFLMLTGCGENNQSIVPNKDNTLFIQGVSVNEKVELNPALTSYDLIAYGNEPTEAVLINLTGQEKKLLGSISLKPYSNIASLDYLVWKDILNKALICLPILTCPDGTTYKIENFGDKFKLSFDLNQSKNEFSVTSINGEEVGNRVPVVVSGNINFTVPSNWPLFQKDRFSAIKVNDIAIDGSIFKIIDFEESKQYYNNELIYTTKKFTLKKNEDISYLSIIFYENKVKSNALISLVYKGGDFKNIEKLSDQFWTEDQKNIEFNLENIELIDHTNNRKLNVSVNLNMPKTYSDLQFGDQKIVMLPIHNRYIATVKNDQKIYNLGFENSNELIDISIIQELAGHLSVKTIVGEQEFMCGNREIPCFGITSDSDRQTFYFHNLKAGANTLNGMTHITGVFEQK